MILNIIVMTLFYTLLTIHVFANNFQIKLCCSDRQPFTDPSSIDALRDYDMKIRDSLPDDFTNLIETIKKIVIYLNKYCRSFYSNTSGSEEDAYDKSVSQATATYMETPFHYNLQRSEFAAAILNHLENIPRLANMYRTQKVIPAKMFGMNVNELARRTDCGELTGDVVHRTKNYVTNASYQT